MDAKKRKSEHWSALFGVIREIRGKVLGSAVENRSPRTSLRQHDAISILETHRLSSE